jgi:capsular polysaccharide biosynthesis protein
MSPLLYFTNLIFADSYEILKRNFKPFIKKTISGKKVFITRDSTKFPDRSISNSEHLTNYMKAKGFEIINQEELSFKDQISYITEAECVVSLVGSSFINVMFCNQDSQLFIIHTDKSQDFGLYMNQSARYDIDSKVIYCDPDGLDIIDYFESSISKSVLRWIHG